MRLRPRERVQLLGVERRRRMGTRWNLRRLRPSLMVGPSSGAQTLAATAYRPIREPEHGEALLSLYHESFEPDPAVYEVLRRPYSGAAGYRTP